VKIVLSTVNSRYTQSSLALLYLETILAREFPFVSVSREEYNIGLTAEEIASDILIISPHIVCLSIYLWNREISFQIIDYLKAVNPEILIIVGGPEISYESEDILSENDGIDYCILGEGEDNFRYLIKELSDGRKPVSKNGLISREDIKKELLIPSEVSDLDNIPSPLQMGILPENRNFIHYESSRGCPFSCGYCLSASKKSVRYFSLERVFLDLDCFFRSDIKMLRFVDRTFNLNKEHFFPIWEYIIQNGPKDKRYQFEIDASLFDDETLEFLRENHTKNFQFEIGIQSISKKALKNVNRSDMVEKIFKISGYLLEHTDVHIHLDLISGLPGDNIHTFLDGIDRIASLMPHTIQIGRLKILKGSPLWYTKHTFGIVNFKYPTYYIIKSDDFSWKDIMKIEELSRINELIYNSERYSTFMRMVLSRKKKYTDFLMELNDLWKREGLNYFGISQRRIISLLVKYIDGNKDLLQAILHDILLKADFKYDPMAAFSEFKDFFVRSNDIFSRKTALTSLYAIKPVKYLHYYIDINDLSEREIYVIYYTVEGERDFTVITKEEINILNSGKQEHIELAGKIYVNKLKLLIDKEIFEPNNWCGTWRLL